MRRWVLLPLVLGLCSCDDDKPAAPADPAAQVDAAAPEPPPMEVRKIDLESLPFYAKGPVATVNAEPVSQERFNRATARFARIATYLDEQRITRYRERILEESIRDTLTEQALRAANVAVPDDAVQAKFDEYMDKNFHDDKDIAEYVQYTGMTPERIKSDIRKALALEAHLDAEYVTSVSDEEVREFYDENPDRFTTQAQVRASHILLDVPEDISAEDLKDLKKDAKKLARKASKEGADFAALAREHSTGPRAAKGGDLGWFEERQMVPAFAYAAFQLEVGGVSEPVRTAQGLHIIKVFERREERVKSFEEAAPEIRESMMRGRKRDASLKFIAAITKAADIKHHPENIVANDKFETRPPRASARIAEGVERPGFDVPMPKQAKSDDGDAGK